MQRLVHPLAVGFVLISILSGCQTGPEVRDTNTNVSTTIITYSRETPEDRGENPNATQPPLPGSWEERVNEDLEALRKERCLWANRKKMEDERSGQRSHHAKIRNLKDTLIPEVEKEINDLRYTKQYCSSCDEARLYSLWTMIHGKTERLENLQEELKRLETQEKGFSKKLDDIEQEGRKCSK